MGLTIPATPRKARSQDKRGGGRRNVHVAMHDCRQARDRWQTAAIARLAAALAAADARIAAGRAA